MDDPLAAQDPPHDMSATVSPAPATGPKRRGGRAIAYIIIVIFLIGAIYLLVGTLYPKPSSNATTTSLAQLSTTTIINTTFSNISLQSSCHVSRIAVPALQGPCNGSLPAYVGLITNKTISSFSGEYSTTPNTTTNVWLYLTKHFYASSNKGQYGPYALNLSANRWYFLSVAMGSNISGSVNTTVYINGNEIYHGPPGVLYALLNFSISAQYYKYISNFQYYNKTLSQQQVAALYNESLGGLPIELAHLTGWFPLNNNTYDHSGLNARFSYSNLSFAKSYPNP